MANYNATSLTGDAQHFFERCDALVDQPLAVFAHRPHALGFGGHEDLALGGTAVDQRTHLVVHGHQLVDAGAALVAGVAALRAAHRVPAAAGVAAPAVHAQLAHQALR